MKGRHKTASSCNSHKQVFGVVSLPSFFFPLIFSALTLFLVTYFFKHTLTTLYFSHTRTHTPQHTPFLSYTLPYTLNLTHSVSLSHSPTHSLSRHPFLSLTASIFRTHTHSFPFFFSLTRLSMAHICSHSPTSLSPSHVKQQPPVGAAWHVGRR